MSDWNSNQYMKFKNERTQPSLDLISRIAQLTPQNILDIGCGPGNSTFALKNQFKNADIIGVDYSDNMLEKARASHPDMVFEKCDVPNGLKKYQKSLDLIFSNACIHWIDNQKELIYKIFDKLSTNGVLAVQIPLTQNAPFYEILYRLVETPKWRKLSEIHNFHNLLPEEYYDLFCKMYCDFNIWQTTYYHIVESHMGVIEWYKGSGLRPYLDKLSESEQEEFISDLSAEIKLTFPEQADGKVILKMPRLFFTLRKK